MAFLQRLGHFFKNHVHAVIESVSHDGHLFTFFLDGDKVFGDPVFVVSDEVV